MTTAWPWQQLAASNAESHELLVELLAPQPGERLLDVGTGSGGLAGCAADRGAECVGVDVAPEAIAAARANHPRARFLVADALAFPFDDARRYEDEPLRATVIVGRRR